MLARTTVLVRLAHAALASLALGCAAASRPAPARDLPPPEGGRQLQLGVGARFFTDEDLGRLDDHVAFALDYCEPMGLGRLRLEGGLSYSHDEADGTSGGEDVRLDADTYEISAGVNWSRLFGRVRPYAGVGATLFFLEVQGIDAVDDVVFDDDDATLGGYAKVGLLLQVTPGTHVGIEYRRLEGGEVSFEGTELDSAYDQVALVFGTSFVSADPRPLHPLSGY